MRGRWPGKGALGAVVTALLASGGAGCARQLDLSKARDTVVRIPYTAEHEETRIYPDYGHLGASILTDDGPPRAARKKGKSP